jgi:hypothetical protein
MLPLRTVLISGVMMMAAASVRAASLGTDANSELVSVYALTFHPELAKTLPAGAMYVCRARVMPGVNAAPQPALGASGGNQSGCALEIPFVWAANRPQPVATLSYEVDEIGADGRVLRRVVREGVALPEPAAGAARHIDVAF